MIAGYFPGISFPNCPRELAKNIPDGQAFAIHFRRTLDLIRGRRGSPNKIIRESRLSGGQCH